MKKYGKPEIKYLSFDTSFISTSETVADNFGDDEDFLSFPTGVSNNAAI
ncbi:MAG: hypothetical protein ACI4RO_00325 [Candidatus Scatosoma sp.]